MKDMFGSDYSGEPNRRNLALFWLSCSGVDLTNQTTEDVCDVIGDKNTTYMYELRTCIACGHTIFGLLWDPRVRVE